MNNYSYVDTRMFLLNNLYEQLFMCSFLMRKNTKYEVVYGREYFFNREKHLQIFR